MLDGVPTMLVFIADLTERNRLEAMRLQMERKLLEAQRMDSLGALAGGVAHDMNNVLGAIMGLAEIHQRKAPAADPLREDMGTVLRACLRGRTMVKGLLEFARKDLEAVEVVDLNHLVREEVALLERTTLQKIVLVMDLAPNLLGLRGEPSSLNHALMNLCVNAVQAMPDGGTLTLRTRTLPGSVVVLDVEDTGVGMTPEVLSHAVDPFFTTRATDEGTGLGLSMVYGVVTSHGGTLEMQSEPGRGTQIRLTFPGVPMAVPVAVPAPEVPRAGQGPLRVLVVDDDELIRDTISGLLELLGLEPHLACGGAEALEQLLEGLAPDRVILDINMPGLDGRQTLDRIRAQWPHLRVLVASGRMDPAAKAIQDVPNVGFLPKPFTLEELQEALR
jgi:CheY-like chemotaxis protein